MTTKVAKRIMVDVPVRAAYNQWTQFEEFPRFMEGVVEVRQLDDRRLHWVAEIAGIRRQWDAEILEQVPDAKIAWAATSGATNAGAVLFTPQGPSRCEVTLELEYEPEGVIEGVGERLHLIDRRVAADLDRFKDLAEGREMPTPGWRGRIDSGSATGVPGVDAAESSRGDKGKAGLSRTMKTLAGLAAAGGVIAAGALKGAREGASTARRERVAVRRDVTVESWPEGRPTRVSSTVVERTELDD